MNSILTSAVVLAVAAATCGCGEAQQPAGGGDAKKSPYEQLVYAEARMREADLLAKLGETLAREKHAHEADAASYSFSARRFGDFLEVEVERHGAKYAGALNLARVTEVRLTEGHPPDLGGRLYYWVSPVQDDTGGSGGYMWLNYPRLDLSKAPDKGYHYAVTASAPLERSSYPTVTLPQVPLTYQSSSCGIVSSNGNSYATIVPESSYVVNLGNSEPSSNYDGVKTPNYARDAEDDRVELAGLGATIYAPAGRGAEVRDEVMRAITAGYEPTCFHADVEHHLVPGRCQ